MALLWRVAVKWTGGQIGSGFTNLFFTESVGSAQQAVDATRTFLSAATTAGGNLPSGVSLTFPSVVDILEPVVGVLLTGVSVTPPAVLNGSGSGAYSAPAGSCITWGTGGVVGGRRVRGRTFLVPLANTAFENNGTLSAVHIGDAVAAANALIAAVPELVVWHRPVGGTGGVAFPALTAKVTDKVAMLTSRR